MSCSAVPAVCKKCKFGWYVTLDYLKAVHCTKCDGTAGSAPVPDAEKAGYFKEKKSKSERKREKQQARAAAIRQARARRAARAN